MMDVKQYMVFLFFLAVLAVLIGMITGFVINGVYDATRRDNIGCESRDEYPNLETRYGRI